MRRFLPLILLFALVATSVPTLGRAQSHTAAVGNDLTADQQALHVLNRLAFGPRPGDIAQVRAMGVNKWIERQLRPDRIDDDSTERVLGTFSLINKDQNELSKSYADFARNRAMLKQARRDSMASAADTMEMKQMLRERVQLVQELSSTRVARAVLSNRQLLEVMTDFWENHFNIDARKGAVEPYYLVEFDRTVREHALGKFRDLLGAVAHSPAMLWYLDNAESRANPGQPTLPAERNNTFARGGTWRGFFGRPRATPRFPPQPNPQPPARQQLVKGLNENYGRELLELHTLGVDGGYTQQDVISVARALTGWTIRPPRQGGGFLFRPEWHDAGEKVVLGHTLRGGRGEADGDDVLDIVAAHPATAHFIAFKLARRLVSDTPPAELVNRAAKRFLTTDGDIREVVRTIVTSPEFMSRAAFAKKVKSPFEVVVSAARAIGGTADTSPRSAMMIARLGQPIFGHQAPNGWPETGDAWMNTGAILNRINFGVAVAADRLPGTSLRTLPWVDSLQTASRAQQVDAVVLNVLGGMASADTRKILMSGTNPLAESASLDSTMMRRPAPVLSGMAQIIGLAIGAPEFQRR